MSAQSLTATLVYTYNGDGLRVAQSVDGEVTEFAWDWATGVPEMLSGGGNLYLVGHETLGRWDGDGWAYYLPDALGSVRQVADDTGVVVDAREWTPYGVEVGGSTDGLGYTGEWQDAALGMVYLRARWLDPQVGRFTQRDPWAGNPLEPISLHSYLYASDHPIKYVDPTGAFSIAEWLRDKAEACYNAGDLDCVWNCYWVLAYGGDIMGYKHASIHLFRFLYKLGDIEYTPAESTPNYRRDYNSDWVRDSPSVQKEIPLLEQKILSMILADARSGAMSGHVEAQRPSVSPDPNTEKDLYYAMNIFSLGAEVDYEVEGCYEVTVRSTYRFWDPYNWHVGLGAGGPAVGVSGFKDEWAAALHDAGLAAEFEVSGYWEGPNKVYTFPSSWLTVGIPLPPTSVRRTWR